MTRPDPLLEVFGFGALWKVRGPAGATESVTEAVTAERKPAAPAVPSVPAVTPVPAVPSEPAVPSVTASASSRAPVAAVSTIEADLASEPVRDIATLNFTALRERVVSCTDCALCETRTNAVFGVGDPQADWLFVGEGPGMNEDEQGEPFVGQAGRLLDNMLLALGLQRGVGVFIANVVKCRPPGNRDPLPDEVAACAPYLRRQIALIQPKVIVALGRFAAQTLVNSDAKISTLRGTVHRYEGLPVIVTYHPAYLLRTLSDKAKAWEDLCLARTTLRALPGEAASEVMPSQTGASTTAGA